MRRRGGRGGAGAGAGAPRRYTIHGELTAPDNYGRMRILLMARRLDGSEDGTAAYLARALHRGYQGGSVPWRAWPDRGDGTVGECWITLPARYRAHWEAEQLRLRGLRVKAETVARDFSYAGADGAWHAGTALDLRQLDPAEPAQAAAALSDDDSVE